MKLHKLTVGLQQKIGQPNFGSVGASCVVEVQLDDHEAGDADVIEQRIRQAFARCRRSIDAELASHDRSSVTSVAHQPSAAAVGKSHIQGQRPATDAQIRAIHTIASKAHVRLASELDAEFGVASPQSLTLQQASELIEKLKSQMQPG
ncbi:hypothetical protein [Rubripirellula reticaptiva]|uniref:Uncharacterized protein n=1 Tax=Rubripirellula reticaptiva TaxID=2528013 RepID=A0A5C6EQF5_9BACT|nr:hypothetical protein [Rubripirellula reticaptiva]TWU51148.1 hypothetical protein Poly59_27380 [Rubripirellula reticaptiva]